MSEYNKKRAPRNRTIILSSEEKVLYEKRLVKLTEPVKAEDIINSTINQDLLQVIDYLPHSFVDLLFIDPPYNLTKNFNTNKFSQLSDKEYSDWFAKWFIPLLKVLKPTAAVYICGDWRSSTILHTITRKYLIVRNRITWEREKGRGAKKNWKNASEDIWFCTMSDDYIFNVDDVKLRRKVIAPYTDTNGKPKDWEKTHTGNYRDTNPSNLWTDLTVPFWSMPENTDHPTQKPEKLLAKIILASTQESDFVFDPFLGVGTTSVVAKKLGRVYSGVEIDTTYSCLAEKRLDLADEDASIQGYYDSIFWERNTLPEQNKFKNRINENKVINELTLFNND
jgi:site-specific DNA-methyltransferase (adenine-specific)